MKETRTCFEFYGIQSPCKDCQKRHAGCHSECKEYAEYKAEHEKRKAEVEQKKRDESALWDLSHPPRDASEKAKAKVKYKTYIHK